MTDIRELKEILEGNIYLGQPDGDQTPKQTFEGYDQRADLRSYLGYPGDEVVKNDADVLWRAQRHAQFGRDITQYINQWTDTEAAMEELQRDGYSQQEIRYGLYMGKHGERVVQVTKEQNTSDTPGWGQRGSSHRR